jgi:hypothetical protein
MSKTKSIIIFLFIFVTTAQSFHLQPFKVIGIQAPKNRCRNYVVKRMSLRDNEPDLFDFVISSVFTSPYFIGSDDIHIPVPIINPDTVPSWMPNGLKTVGSAALKITQQAAEKGLIKRSDPGARFTMKYGVLRGKLDATQSCAVCASTSAAALDTDKPLTNINDAERSRRITAGYSLAAVAVACSAVADLSGAPFNTRLAFALPLALGWAFYESGRTGL